MALEIYELQADGERVSVWRNPLPGSTRVTKLQGMIMKVKKWQWQIKMFLLQILLQEESSEIVKSLLISLQQEQNSLEEETLETPGGGPRIHVRFRER